MSNIDFLGQQVETMCSRLTKLYRSADTSSALPPELLPVALKELGVASEELQIALEELARQNEELAVAQAKTEAERQRYQNLFECATDAYMITDVSGTIHEANRASAVLFHRQQQFLSGKPLTSLVVFNDRPLFRAKLSQLPQRDHFEITIKMQRSHTEEFDAVLVAEVLRDYDANPMLRWCIRDISERKRVEAFLEVSDYDLRDDRPVHYFSKGDIIPLQPQAIWLVCEGLVKLTTLSDAGEDILVGLAAENMAFGSSLTSLQTYQALVLSDAQLVSLPLMEIAQYPRLAQALLPLINQRLRQTESFLAVYGQIHVQDRLNRLLKLLKQEIGQPVPQGTRLSVRLTHQDFASACCTTRVTITRLLGKLQQQGKILIDRQNHLIIVGNLI